MLGLTLHFAQGSHTSENISYEKCSIRRNLFLTRYLLPVIFIIVSDRILLRDVKALTLHYDRYTTSRRLNPIPQLKCVGGTAGCDSYTPKVVQCQNKGWDGYDVQVIFIMPVTV